MRVRVALTLFLALVLGILAAPAGAQEPAGDTTAVDALHVARPRAAILTVFQSGAEAFVHLEPSDATTPIHLVPRSGHVPFVADYEAVLMPLTAGYADFELHVWRDTDAGRERLAGDEAHVVAFGPFKRAGRLKADVALQPGLHHLHVLVTAKSRAVGVAEWTTDSDDADLWVYVPSSTAAAAGRLANEELVRGGLGVGSHRGAATELAVGAVNFETGHDTTVVVKVGESVRVWSDYELWWADGAAGDGRAALVVRQRTPQPGANPELGRDVAEPSTGGGPFLADGNLAVVLSFAEPGTYHLAAQLATRIRQTDMVATDEDLVPFNVLVLGDAPRTGNVTGVVTDADGIPLEGVLVEAVGAANSGAAAKSRSGPDGGYKLEGLAPGEVLVHAIPEDLNYLGEWWKESPSRAGAWPVTIEAGRTADGINFTLTPGATITGHVTHASGQPLAGIEILVGTFLRATDPANPQPMPGDLGVVGRTRTNADGLYAVDQLPAGRFWVRSMDPEGRVLAEYYDDALSLSDADPVVVATGATAAGIDFVLAAGGGVAGHVWGMTPDPNGRRALAEILVEVRAPDNPERVLGRAVTNQEGRYRIGGLLPGSYLVKATDPAGRFAAEWYKEVTRPEEATPVQVPGGQVVDGIDFTLGPLQRTARVFVRPPVLGLAAGGEGELAIAVAGVENLAAFDVGLAWNSDVFTVTGVQIGDFLGSTGRQVIPVTPELDNEHGTLRFAAATAGTTPGASGEGILFVVHVAARNPGETGLEIAASVLTDPTAALIEHTRDHGRVYVGRCMRGDFDCNCVIDIRDVMAVVLHWGTSEGDPGYEAQYDLDADGDVDIVDVQIEAGMWGKRCTPTPVALRGRTSGAPEPAGGAAPGGFGQDAAELTPGLPSDRGAGAGGLLPGYAAAGYAPLGTTLELALVAGTPGEAGDVVVAVRTSDAVDLAGFDLTLGFDPAALEFKSAVLGDLLSGSQRTFVALGPSTEVGQVRFGAYSFPGPAAPSGGGDLALLTFAVRAQGSTTLRLEQATTVDSVGAAMPGSHATLDLGGALIPEPAGVFLPYADGGD